MNLRMIEIIVKSIYTIAKYAIASYLLAVGAGSPYVPAFTIAYTIAAWAVRLTTRIATEREVIHITRALSNSFTVDILYHVCSFLSVIAHLYLRHGPHDMEDYQYALYLVLVTMEAVCFVSVCVYYLHSEVYKFVGESFMELTRRHEAVEAGIAERAAAAESASIGPVSEIIRPTEKACVGVCCIICADKPPTMLLEPCNHVASCEGCLTKYEEMTKTEDRTCHVCKTAYETVKLIHIC